MLPLALDVMGGDNAPGVVIEGARRARDELGAELLMVGLPEVVEPLAAEGFEVLAATEVVEMHDDPASSVRRKRDSSLVRCAELVRDGKAVGMISAGNTGAAMASALLKFGRLPRVARPAIATTIPVPGSTPTVVLDSGANSDVIASWLVQFAEMGSVYSSDVFGVESPRVGILSIGEEKGKGNELVKEAYPLLEACDRINFIGNVEGRDVMSDRVDVVVCDGYTGNIVLKT
ncbi:MAG: phosphate acyltransferase PlsX, partial [Actinomycetota bacterium]|nr:phosphate acyltransferase PlsX [Actinomycetota bacterium]